MSLHDEKVGVVHHDMKLDNWPNIFTDTINLECCYDVFVCPLIGL
jgi:hypothetical protein